MNVAYWLAVTMSGIFIFFILTITFFPLLLLIMPAVFPGFVKWCQLNFIKQIIDLFRFIYSHFLLRILFVVFFFSLFIILVFYLIYFVGKYILMKEPITASVGQQFLDFIVIKEFTDLGIFPFFDTILSRWYPEMFGGESPKGSIATAISNFSTSFVQKIKEGDGSKPVPEPEPSSKTVTNNPNLTDDQNNAVNANFEKCIKDSTPGAYHGNDQIQLLKYQLQISGAKTKCEALKIIDSIKITNTK